MYVRHRDLEQPSDEAILWRYLDFTKFVSLLDRSALFFVRADKLDDPFEGAYTKVNMDSEVQKLLVPRGSQETRASLFQFLRGLRERTHISCWYEGEVESDAMWRLFVAGRNGVALKTTFSALSESFLCEERVLAGRVAYKDYDSEIISMQSTLYPYFHKRTSFSHEREVRALTQDPRQSAPTVPVGAYLEVDLGTLIQEVRVSPDADDWFLELVHSVATKYAINVPIAKSKLAELPIWASDPGIG